MTTGAPSRGYSGLILSPGATRGDGPCAGRASICVYICRDLFQLLLGTDIYIYILVMLPLSPNKTSINISVIIIIVK